VDEGEVLALRFIVELTDAERGTLQELLAGGEERARKLKRAQILLATDQRLADETIAQALGCGTSTVYRIKRRFVEEGFDAALVDRP
jgi:DNA-binding GntR family transcriptional regulator